MSEISLRSLISGVERKFAFGVVDIELSLIPVSLKCPVIGTPRLRDLCTLSFSQSSLFKLPR